LQKEYPTGGKPLMTKDRKTIALLSDNGRLEETLKLDLEDEGFNVIPIAGVERDLQIFRGVQINMLILDLDTHIWEISFVKEVRRIRPVLPIVLLSSFEEKLTDFLFNRIEIASTFIKPFELERFTSSINAILTNNA
jgi:DNA-binding response OmpR family regulator